MQLLTQLAALLRDGDSYTIRLQGTQAGTNVIIEAALADVSPDEPNEALRNIQVALAMPLILKVPKCESVSHVVPAALDAYLGAKASAVEARDLLISSIQQATADAKAAARSAAGTTKKGKTVSVAKEHTAADADDADDDGSATTQTLGESQPSSPSSDVAGQAAPAGGLFD